VSSVYWFFSSPEVPEFATRNFKDVIFQKKKNPVTLVMRYVRTGRCQFIYRCIYSGRQSQWPRGLRCGSAAARLLKLWARIPPGAWMSVCCEYCLCCQVEVLRRADHSSREVIPTESVVLCDLET